MRKLAIRPSSAMLVATLALVAAVTGAAAANPVANKAVTTKKAKKIADKEIKKKAPGLSVAHADSATSAAHATSADTATSANPTAFAKVNSSGDVIESDSRGISDANVVGLPMGQSGLYCVKGLGFTPRSVQVTVDHQGSVPNDDFAQAALGDAGGRCDSFGVTGTQALVQGLDADSGGTAEDVGFFMWLASG